MGKFDDLFNKFFGRKREEKKEDNESFDDAKARNIKGLIDMLSKFEDVSDLAGSGQFDNEMGEPDKIEYYEEDGMYFQKKTWKVFGGEMVKIIASDEPIQEEPAKKSKSLEELLTEAVENEDYEKAASIRDEIAKEKKN